MNKRSFFSRLWLGLTGLIGLTSRAGDSSRSFYWHSGGKFWDYKDRKQTYPNEVLDGEIWFSQREGRYYMLLNGQKVPCNGTCGTPCFNVEDWENPQLLRDVMRYRHEDALWWQNVCPSPIREVYAQGCKEDVLFRDIYF